MDGLMGSLSTWKNHPAPFSIEVLNKARPLLKQRLNKGSLVLDPFAGTGRIHTFGETMGWDTVGVEIEVEGANMHPQTLHGDATNLPAEWTDTFHGTFTSCGYGSRMSDHHDAKERCKTCAGTGMAAYPTSGGFGVGGMTITSGSCMKCGGEGRRHYKRNTYRHTIGHELHINNSGRMQWSESYRDLHERAWAEVTRVTRQWFCLNISNHIRSGREVDVTSWHVETIEALGWTEVERVPVYTPRNGFGANRDLRVENEWLILFVLG